MCGMLGACGSKILILCIWFSPIPDIISVNSPPPELDVEVLVALPGSEAQPGVERAHQLQHVPTRDPFKLCTI